MPVTITGKFKRASDRAVLLDLSIEEDTGLESFADNLHWFPRSQLLPRNPDFSCVATDAQVTIQITDWIARQKNITSNVNVPEVDLEHFVVEYLPAENVHVVYDPDRMRWCTCDNARYARMIAAALNLTQGKV